MSWDIKQTSYDNINFDISSEMTSPVALCFKNNGTKMYALATVGSNTVFQYSLSTAWDISTASYDSISFSFASQDIFNQSLFFRDDGVRMYMAGRSNVPETNRDGVYGYNLSTAWNVSTASLLDGILVDTVQTSITGLFFKPDGTKLYIIGISPAEVSQWSLSTAWDISTTTYDSITFTISEDLEPGTIFFKPDGRKFFVMGVTNDTVFQYSLSTAWDLSTASYDSISFSVNTVDSVPRGLAFKDDGAKMYINGQTNDKVYQFSLIDIKARPIYFDK